MAVRFPFTVEFVPLVGSPTRVTLSANLPIRPAVTWPRVVESADNSVMAFCIDGCNGVEFELAKVLLGDVEAPYSGQLSADELRRLAAGEVTITYNEPEPEPEPEREPYRAPPGFLDVIIDDSTTATPARLAPQLVSADSSVYSLFLKLRNHGLDVGKFKLVHPASGTEFYSGSDELQETKLADLAGRNGVVHMQMVRARPRNPDPFEQARRYHEMY